MKSKLIFSGLCALSVLCGSLLLTGCGDGSPAEKVERIAKLGTYAALVKDPSAADDIERAAAVIDDALATHTVLNDELVTEILARLVEGGRIKSERAIIVSALIDEVWSELRPKGGQFDLGNEKVRTAVQSFTKGIRAALKRVGRLQQAAPPPTS